MNEGESFAVKRISVICLAALSIVFVSAAFSCAADYSSSISREIRKFLKEGDWKYSFDSSKGVFTMGVSLKGELKNVDYSIRIHEKGYTVYAVSPVKADNEKASLMSEMAEFICRANYGLRNGNFELDFRDGEIRYKIFVDCDNRLPSKDIIENSIIIPGLMFQRYSVGMFDIMFRGSSASRAISKCED